MAVGRYIQNKYTEMAAKILLLGGLLLVGLGSCRDAGQCASRRDSSVLDTVVGPAGLTLVFSGDIMQHLPQVNAARQPDGTYDYSACFRYIRPFWEHADFAVVNLETTLSYTGPYSGYPRFSSPAALAVALRDAGVDVVALANNHSCDRGERGIRTTLRVADSLGLQCVGAYADSIQATRPLILEKKPFRVALLNATYSTNGLPVPQGMKVHMLDTLRMAREVAAARKQHATHVVLFAHWGEEYQQQPHAAQRRVADWCRRQGIDVVVGSHPHVAQPIDTAARVVWSLGNFVSNQRKRYQDGGLNVRIRLFLHHPPRVEMLPHWVWKAAEEGRYRYYILPAYAAGMVAGMDSADHQTFLQSLDDNRTVAGAVDEVVL